MDPVSHALTAAALDRAGLGRISRSAMAILIVSGTAADLDLLSYFFGANAYFHYHYALLHSILGSAVLAIVITLLFCVFDRPAKRAPLRFPRVFLLCIIGASVHVLLDWFGAEGVQLLSPFRVSWFSRDWLPEIDPWILALLLIGFFLPTLFRLVTEEIAGRKKKQAASTGTVIALALVAVYIAGRGVLHRTAVRILMEHDYHGAAPLVSGAFPDSTSPFSWRGVVATANTIEVVNAQVGPGDTFDAMSSLTHYKPAGSPQLDAAHRALLAAQFLRYAQFPLADVQSTPAGSTVTLHDLRFDQDSSAAANMSAVIELDGALRLRDERIEFPATTTSK